MRAFLVLVTALSMLTGCATGGGLDRTKVAEVVADVQATATEICSFVPSDATVTAILSAVESTSTTVGLVRNVADLVCAAIVRRSGAGTPQVVVSGRTIPVKGKYVRKR